MKKTKKMAKKKTSTSRRARLKLTTVEINLESEQRDYVAELAEYACTDISTVCAVMMACGIFKAKRFELRSDEKELAALRAQLDRCRNVMEVNDPGNARDIFGPPATTAPTEGAPTVP